MQPGQHERGPHQARVRCADVRKASRRRSTTSASPRRTTSRARPTPVRSQASASRTCTSSTTPRRSVRASPTRSPPTGRNLGGSRRSRLRAEGHHRLHVDPDHRQGREPDGVYFGGVTASGGARILKAAVQVGLGDIPYMGPDGIRTAPARPRDSFLNLAGARRQELLRHAAGNADYPGGQVRRSTRPSSARTPTGYAIQGYACMQIAARRHRPCGRDQPERRRRGPRRGPQGVSDPTHKYQTAMGEITFDANGDTSQKTMSVYKVDLTRCERQGCLGSSEGNHLRRARSGHPPRGRGPQGPRPLVIRHRSREICRDGRHSAPPGLHNPRQAVVVHPCDRRRDRGGVFLRPAVLPGPRSRDGRPGGPDRDPAGGERALDQRDLRPHRPGLHDGLRDHRAHQLRPRRRVHDRGVPRTDLPRLGSTDPRSFTSGPVNDPARCSSCWSSARSPFVMP